jgi:hypothetical protein
VQIVLLFSSGARVTGLLAAAMHDHLRIVLPGRQETVELRRICRALFCDTGECVEIEAIVSAPPPPPPVAPRYLH